MGKDQELLEAGRSGDTNIIQKLLSPRTKKTGSIVPPVFASLRRGPGPNVQDTNGDTSLHLAALNGHTDAVKTLLHYDASANVVDNTGCYPLHLAAWSGNAEICDILLTHGPSIAKVNEQNAAGDTALHTAAQYGHAEAVQVLLTNLSDPTIRNNRDETALDLASQYGRIQTVNLLLKHCISLLSCATIKHSPLHLASRNGHMNVVTALLDAGFDVNTCTENGSALHEAALYGKPEVVKLLLTRDIDTSLQDTQGKTAVELIENHTSPKALQIANVIRVHTGELYQDSDLEQANPHRMVHPVDSISSYEYVNEVQSDSPDLNDLLDLESPVEEQVSLAHSQSIYENVSAPIPKPVPAPRRARDFIKEEYASVRKDVAQVPIQSIQEGRRISNSPPVPERSSSMTNHREDQEFDEECIYDTPRPDLPPKDYRRQSASSGGPYMDIGEINTPASKKRTISNASNKHPDPFPEIQRPPEDESGTYVPMGEVKRKVSEDNDGAYIRMESIKSAGKMEIEAEAKEKKPSQRLEDQNSSGSDDDDYIPPEDEAEELRNTYELLSEAQSGLISETGSSSDDVSLGDSAEKSEQENMEKDALVDDDSGVEELPKEPPVKTTIAKPPSLEFDSKRSSRASRSSTCSEIPVSPTGYIQPPTPDFPPPSPMTAILGIQEHINPQEKRRSRDMETSTEIEMLLPRPADVIKASSVTAVTLQDEGKIVDSTENSCDDLDDEDGESGSSEDEKPVVEEVKRTEKEPFLGLIKGANAGGTRRAISQIYDNIVIVGNSRPKRASMSSIPTHFDPLLENEEGLTPVFKDLDEIVSDIKTHRQNRRSTSQSDSEGSDRRSAERGLVNGNDDSGNVVRRDQRRTMTSGIQGQEENDDWAEIADIMATFGGRITRESMFMKDFEEEFAKLISASGKVQSVGHWLEGQGLGQYENILVANGFDDMDFMGSSVLEEADLFEMGLYNDDHRCRIVDATKKLPHLKPIDVKNLPESVEAWLKTIHLTSYLSTFIDHDFCTMEKVHKMWELELTTVLDITTLGHRKRILASLGNKGSEKNKETLESLDFSNLSRSCSKSSYTASHSTLSETWNLSPVSGGPGNDEVFSFAETLESKPSEPKNSPIKDINLFKDYSNVKSTVELNTNGTHDSLSVSSGTGSNSSSRDNIHMGTGSFRREKRRSHHEDQANRRSNRVSYSGIDLRPPIETMTVATDEVHAWRHRPEVLIKGCCNYVAHYLGSTLIRDLQGLDSTKESIVKMKKATDQIAKVPMIMLSITYKGVKFIDAKTKKVICEHEIGNIFCACQDAEHLNFFAYITKDLATGKHYCHVFSVKTNDLAAEIILTLGEAFEVAYQVALKERALQTDREYEEQLDETEREFEAALN